jgi:hypothetical protein
MANAMIEVPFLVMKYFPAGLIMDSQESPSRSCENPALIRAALAVSTA